MGTLDTRIRALGMPPRDEYPILTIFPRRSAKRREPITTTYACPHRTTKRKQKSRVLSYTRYEREIAEFII